MITGSWLRNLFSPKPRRLAARPRLRPRLEVLESRLAPAVLTVNTGDGLADRVDLADGLLSLREALSLVNAAGDATAALGRSLTAAEAAQITGTFGSADTVQFASELSGGTVSVPSGQLSITKSVSITGPAGGLTINAHSASRIFRVDDGTTAAIDVALSGLTLFAGVVHGDSGGAIFNAENLSLTNCTIKGNIATGAFAKGAGIYNAGRVSLTNCAIWNNGGNIETHGSGIYNAGTATLTNCTIAGNNGVNTFGGNGISNGGALTLNNSIVANNAGLYQVIGAISSSSIAGSHNIIWGHFGVRSLGTNTLTDTISSDPLLGPLQDNGGPSKTMALQPGSPALDAGDSSLAPLTDQRGVARDAQPDLGAWEKATPILTWTPAAITYGTALSTTQLSATAAVLGSSVPGSFAYTPAAGTVLAAGSQALSVIFTPTDTANSKSASKSVTLVVNPAPLTVTPAAGQSKVYGAAVPALSYSASGFVNNDPASTLTGALGTAATAASPVGSYAFTLSSLSAGANYTLALAANPATFAVTPAALTVTPAAGQSKVYGAAVPTLTYSASGFVNNDPASTLTGALGTAATAASPVGSYAFTLGSLSAGANYTLALAVNPPTFAVTKATLTITANDQTKIAGEANPAFTVRYSGFVLGEGPGVLGGTLTFSTPATTGSPPGTYAITPGGLTSGNYAITFVSGTLTVFSYSQAMNNLLARVDAAGLDHGTQNSLDSQLQAAIASFNQGDTTTGKNQLGAFINSVSARRGQQIDAALADALIAYAQRILNAVP